MSLATSFLFASHVNASQASSCSNEDCQVFYGLIEVAPGEFDSRFTKNTPLDFIRTDYALTDISNGLQYLSPSVTTQWHYCDMHRNVYGAASNASSTCNAKEDLDVRLADDAGWRIATDQELINLMTVMERPTIDRSIVRMTRQFSEAFMAEFFHTGHYMGDDKSFWLHVDRADQNGDINANSTRMADLLTSANNSWSIRFNGNGRELSSTSTFEPSATTGYALVRDISLANTSLGLLNVQGTDPISGEQGIRDVNAPLSGIMAATLLSLVGFRRRKQ